MSDHLLNRILQKGQKKGKIKKEKPSISGYTQLLYHDCEKSYGCSKGIIVFFLKRM
jgi:hypothetical protein